MAIYQQRGSSNWWIDFTVNGRRVRQSTGTDDKRKAKEYHDRVKAQAWAQTRLGTKPRHSYRAAVVRFLEETKVDRKGRRRVDLAAFRWLDGHLGEKYLDEITKDVIANLVVEKKRPYTKISKTGKQRFYSPCASAVNDVLSTLRSLLYRARDEWEWAETVPKIKLLSEPPGRVRWLTRGEADKLIAELPSHLAVLAEFSLQTGLRRANATHLEWAQVDLDRKTAWFYADQTKNAKALAVPLNERAIEILVSQRAAQQEQPSRWVFPWRGKPLIQTCTKAFRAALKRAGILDFHWHDLRHTWASWHVQNGTPLHVLQELGGWSSLKLVQRYAHLSGEHLRSWVDRTSER
jgi:integrase